MAAGFGQGGDWGGKKGWGGGVKAQALRQGLLHKNGNFYKKFIKQVQGMTAEIHLPAQKVQTLYSSIELHNTRGRGPRVWFASEDPSPQTPPSTPPSHIHPLPPHPPLNTFTKDSLHYNPKIYRQPHLHQSIEESVSFLSAGWKTKK